MTNSGADATLSEGGGPAGTIYSGIISDGAGTVALIHTGGDVTFTGDSTYSGGTTIAGGTLRLGDGGLSGSITGDVLNNSVLAVNRSDTSSLLGDITGIGSLVKSGAGQLILDGDNHYSGATDILGGSIVATDDFALSENSAFRVNTGAGLFLDDGVDAAIGSLADGPLGGGFVVLGFADPFTFLQIGLDDTDTTFSGIITGAGSLEKTGTGIQTLTGVGSAIGGDLILCDCGGSGGLVLAGGTFDAGGDIEMFDSDAFGDAGRHPAPARPEPGDRHRHQHRAGLGRRIEARGGRRGPHVRQRRFRHAGRRLSQLDRRPGDRRRRKQRDHLGRRIESRGRRRRPHIRQRPRRDRRRPAPAGSGPASFGIFGVGLQRRAGIGRRIEDRRRGHCRFLRIRALGHRRRPVRTDRSVSAFGLFSVDSSDCW